MEDPEGAGEPWMLGEGSGPEEPEEEMDEEDKRIQILKKI